MLKRTICLFLTAALLLCAGACGAKSNDTQETSYISASMTETDDGVSVIATSSVASSEAYYIGGIWRLD
jgi:hypothetical protein